MNAYHFPQLDETIYMDTLSNGLRVCVVPRPGFSRRLAYFVTDFGSIHTDFLLEGREIHAPAGIAHFLEHKMFDLPQGNAMQEFAKYGGGNNAFTSYSMTAYYFECTENFEENLSVLLQRTTTPYRTPQFFCFSYTSVVRL